MSISSRERFAALGVILLCIFAVGSVLWFANEAKGLPDKDRQSAPVGWVAVAGAILVFGSYAIMIKSDEVQKANADPMAFQLFLSTGVVACNMYEGWNLLR